MEKLATEMNEPIPAKEVSHNYFEYEESSKCCSEENTKEQKESQLMNIETFQEFKKSQQPNETSREQTDEEIPLRRKRKAKDLSEK